MSGIKGMKKYPQGIREKIVSEHNNGASQCWLGTIQSKGILPKKRGRKPAKALQEYNLKQN